jgi:hypothetical protein
MKRILIPIFAAALLVGCGTTANIENSWRDPEAAIDMNKLNKVLVIALLKNETHRRSVESHLTGMLKGKGVASYNYLNRELNKQTETELKQKLKNDGFDGAIVMRLADVDKDITYVPGSYGTYPRYYGRFWPYLSASWNYYYQPGYFETTKRFTVETNVYSLRKDKLVWSGLTSSADPQSAEKLMQAVAKEVYGRMKKDGFIVAD